jgi:uncharacterized phage protein (TIGR02218 family)
MKNITPQMQNHLNTEILTLCECLKITRRDGIILGFTTHDNPLIIDGLSYLPNNSFNPSAIIGTSDLKVDNLEIEGMISDDSIKESDILSGKYDHAEILIFQVNYNDLTAGKIIMRYGFLGEVRFDGSNFVAELGGLTTKLNSVMGEIYSATCRAKLGDSACKINLATRTVSGAVTSTISNSIFVDSSRIEVAGTFTHGVLKFTSGANTGLKFEVKADSNKQIKLMLEAPYQIAIGDTYTLTQGCDKRFATCKTRFNNAINFRGEPHLIGIDRLLETSATSN